MIHLPPLSFLAIVLLFVVPSFAEEPKPIPANRDVRSNNVRTKESAVISVRQGRGTELLQKAPTGTVVKTTSGTQGEILQQKQEWRILLESEEPTAKKRILPLGGQLLGKGWKNFNDGNYEEAISIFTFALPLTEVNIEATFGLASCYSAQRKYDEALPLFETLVQKRFHLKDTLPELLTLLLERGEYQKAAGYAALLDDKVRDSWQRRIEQGLFVQKLRIVKKSDTKESYAAFVAEYELDLKQCRMADTFNDIAATFFEKGQPDRAIAIYSALLSCSKDEDFRIGIFYSLKPLLPPREILAIVEKEKSADAGSPEYLKKLDTFKVNILYTLLETDPDRIEEVTAAILGINPGDQVALSALGWYYLRNQRYEEAYNCFSQLYKMEPEQPNHVTGMIYSLSGMKEFEKALMLAQGYRNDVTIAGLEKEIKLRILWNKVSALASDSPELEEVAREILVLKPGDEAIRVIRAWGYYNREEYEKSYQEFYALYNENPREKGYAYGLVSALRQLKKYDEAVQIAVKNREHDERLAAVETEIYHERARFAYQQKRYHEADLYFAKFLEAEPDDEDVKSLLESSRYRQTALSKVLSPIVGLSGFSYGAMSHDLQGATGTGASMVFNQGIDLVKLPWDVLLRTYGELSYRTRSKDFTYYDLFGHSLGIELKKSIFRLGAEYVSEQYTTRSKLDTGPHLFLGWYHDWYKYLYDRSEEAGWFNINSLAGSTYGKVSDDLGGSTGTGISGSIIQSINWLTLPGNVMLNSFAEYRYNFRTRDNVYYNEHGPVVGTELQRSPFRAGIECYWEHDTERHLLNSRISVYLKWYYGWDLKPNK